MTAESCIIFDGKKTPGPVDFPKLKPSNDKINSSKEDGPRLGQAGSGFSLSDR